MMSLMSAAMNLKTVGFEPPALTPSLPDSDSSDDCQEDSLESAMRKAKELTTKRRLQKMVGDAIQLDQRNNMAQMDVAMDQRHQRQRRMALLRSASKKDVKEGAALPRMMDIVMVAKEKPIVKFRRRARAVLRVIQVCIICKEILSNRVRQEPWYALIDNLMAVTAPPKRKGPRPFVTFVPNEKRQLVQLTFDVADYKREHRTEMLLTDDIRQMMSILPGKRSPQQVAEILGVLKGMFRTFCHYRLSIQKAIAQHAFYDKYKANRVIVKKGQWPDGIYFVLTGCVVEKHEGGKHPKVINAGDRFGEGDLLCGNRRRHTVLTKVDSEIFYLHKQDYRDIFDLAEDRNNPKNLDICKAHIVFQHFPMSRLVDNPGTWSVNTYKYGELIAADLHHVDWIYVIKSGEARVLKYLETSQVDVKGRRKKVQAQINEQCPFYKKRQLLDFLEDRNHIQSSYHQHPPSSSRQRLRSAPPSLSRARPHSTPLLPSRPSISQPSMRKGPRPVTTASKPPSSRRSSQQQIPLFQLVLDQDPDQGQGQAEVNHEPKVKESQGQGHADELLVIQETVERLPDDLATGPNPASYAEEGKTGGGGQQSQGHSGEGRLGGKERVGEDSGRKGEGGGGEEDSSLKPTDTPKRFLERRLSADVQGPLFDKPQVPGQPGRRQSILLPSPPPPSSSQSRPRPSLTPSQRSGKGVGRKGGGGGKEEVHIGQQRLPGFVQVDTLHPGQAFGFRACLDPEERGPTVSLVSGECEVLQINKKFFMRHCDDAIYSLIRLKNKPFPSQEELVDRLDVNLKWEEFKQQHLQSVLARQCRPAR